MTEARSVSLLCTSRRGGNLTNVTFYKNDEVIQNDNRDMLNISVVSKSDEGFYKCKIGEEEVSQESWMSVRREFNTVLVCLLQYELAKPKTI